MTVCQGGDLLAMVSIHPRKAAGNRGIVETSGKKQKVGHLHLSSEYQMLACLLVWRRIKLSLVLLIDRLQSKINK